jgi:hypothetical protein
MVVNAKAANMAQIAESIGIVLMVGGSLSLAGRLLLASWWHGRDQETSMKWELLAVLGGAWLLTAGKAWIASVG